MFAPPSSAWTRTARGASAPCGCLWTPRPRCCPLQTRYERHETPIMIISSTSDYRAAAQKRLPPFLFHYIDGGAYAEQTLRRNVEDLAAVALRQRVLKDMSRLDTSIELFGEKLSIPVALSRSE